MQYQYLARRTVGSPAFVRMQYELDVAKTLHCDRGVLQSGESPGPGSHLAPTVPRGSFGGKVDPKRPRSGGDRVVSALTQKANDFINNTIKRIAQPLLSEEH